MTTKAVRCICENLSLHQTTRKVFGDQHGSVPTPSDLPHCLLPTQAAASETEPHKGKIENEQLLLQLFTNHVLSYIIKFFMLSTWFTIDVDGVKPTV